MTAWKREHRKLRREPAPPTAPGEKWCRSCRQIKPVSFFGNQAATSDGLQAYCKPCFAIRYRRRREAEGKLSRPMDIPDGHKFCRSCRQVLPLGDFGSATRCRTCAAVADKAYHLAKHYGLTLEEHEALLAAQNGKCAICLTAPAVHVDHDHATGKVRGMLCFRCNAALGQFDDKSATLLRAARYLLHAGQDPSVVELHWTGRLAEAEYGSAS